MTQRRQRDVDSIRLDDFSENLGYYSDEVDAVVQKFSDSEVNADDFFAHEPSVAEDVLIGSDEGIFDMSDVADSPYGGDVDDFLNSVNKKFTDKHEEELEAARWKTNRIHEVSEETAYASKSEGTGMAAQTAQKKKTAAKSKTKSSGGMLSSIGAGSASKSGASKNSKKTSASSAKSRPAAKTSATSSRSRTDLKKITQNEVKTSRGIKGLVDDPSLDDAPIRKTQRSSLKSSFSSEKAKSGTTRKSSSSGYDSRSSRHSAKEMDAGRREYLDRKARYEKKTPVGVTILKYVLLLIFCIVVAVVSIKGYNTAYELFHDIPYDSKDLGKIEVTTTGEETDEEMAQKLVSAGVIGSADLYVKRCKLYKPEYRYGTFKLSKAFNMEKITNILSGYNYSKGTMEEEETPVEEEPIYFEDGNQDPEAAGAEVVPEGEEFPEGEEVPEG